MRTNANIAGIKPTITGTITLSGGTTISLTDRDFQAGSLNFKSGTSNSGEFSVGAAIIGACSFGLMNDTGRFDGVSWYDSSVSITITAAGTVLPMGEFLVVSHKETGRVIAIEAYDRMKLLDEYGLYEHQITWPATAQSVVAAICTARGLTYTGLAYPSMSLEDPGDTDMTERECISYIAQMMGQFVLVKNNVLTFGWYDLNTVFNAGNSFSHDFQTSDTTIGGVTVKVDENTKQTQGSGTLITVENNPFVTATNLATVTTQIYNAVNGIQYRIGSANILSNPAIEAGDRLLINTETDTVIILATTVTYKPQLQMSVQSDGSDVSDLRLNKTDRIKKIANQQANKAIGNQLNDPNSDLSRAIAGGGGSATKRTGGTNNQYGTYSNYNNANRRTVYIDNAGVKLGQQASLDITAGYSGTIASKACTAKWFMASDETTGATNDGTPNAPVAFKKTRTQSGLVTDRHQGGRDTTATPASMFAQVDFGVGPDGSGNFGEGPAGLSVRVETAGTNASTYAANLRHELHIGNPEQDAYVSPDPIYKSYNLLHGVTSLLGLFRMDQARIYANGAWYPGFVMQNTQTTPSGSTATYCAIWMSGFPAGPTDSGVALPVIYIQACDHRGIVNANAQRYKIDITT